MSFIKEHKIGITVAVIIILAFVLYGVFFTGEDEEILTSTGPVDVGGQIGAELITTLFQLKSIKLDDKIFFDNIFSSLVDFYQAIPLENQGRDNPFAPIGPSSASDAGSADEIGEDDGEDDDSGDPT